MKRIFLTLVLIFSITFSQAQKNPEQLVETFFKEYTSQGTKIALTNLYSTNPWIEEANESVTNLTNQLPNTKSEMLGAYIGYELITSKKITKDYVLLSYFVKYDRQLLRFTFTFYKPYDKWRLIAIKFDDSFGSELEELMKLYYKNF